MTTASESLTPAISSARPIQFRKVLSGLLSHSVLILGAAFILLPFIWMLLTSVRSPDEIFEGSLWPWPRNFYGAEHYAAALQQVPMLGFMLNGVIVCAGILIMQLLVAIPAAYALAKLRFPGRGLLFALVVAGLAIPIQVPALPLYMGLAFTGLLNTYFAMMFPFFLSVFAIFLLRQSFKTFPDEIIEAARLDGMSEMEIVWRVVVPSARPAIAAFSIFSIVAHWNDLYWPLIVINDTALAPPPLGMMFFADAEVGTNYGALMAGATIVTAPLVLTFLALRRRFIQGITMTGIK
ncbi:carbohydrate ABC transporter permease [Chelativorans salis]|uniref:sn-glycerol-3-phosphate transport system permease protein UgpE n=1 Tax=Chelativorans salis TaxID=2978478 RepID=A0ABT2LHS0_9HYPH|nr:carbohydrate ABC transporter permease [Chelativorans sp. EGI FJ00035]MCT7374111.1 carbohydrate ABC transporter permease [Chelativorans sp. EGI FJ00035]